MFTIQGELLDQANEFFSLDPLPDDHDLEHPGVPHPEPDPDTPRSFSRSDNPDKFLFQGQIGVSFERFFRSPSEIGSVYAAAAKHSSLIGLRDERDSIVAEGVARCLRKQPQKQRKDCTRLHFFARARPGDHPKRVASAFTFSVGVTERRKTTSTGVEIPVEFRTDKWGETYTVQFDPQKLRLQPSRVKSAYAALASYTKLYKLSDPLGKSPAKACSEGKGPIHCLKELSTINVASRAFRFLPAFEVKTVDQFDFAAVGGRFFFDATNEENILTYKLSWDLSTVFDDRQRKIDAMDAVKAHLELAADLPVIKTAKLEIKKGEFAYEKLEGARVAEWKAGPQWHYCEAWPNGITLESNGRVVGTAALNQAAKKVCVQVTDAAGRTVSGTIEITVR